MRRSLLRSLCGIVARRRSRACRDSRVHPSLSGHCHNWKRPLRSKDVERMHAGTGTGNHEIQMACDRASVRLPDLRARRKSDNHLQRKPVGSLNERSRASGTESPKRAEKGGRYGKEGNIRGKDQNRERKVTLWLKWKSQLKREEACGEGNRFPHERAFIDGIQLVLLSHAYKQTKNTNRL